ncbi:MAG TPA: hypothetical protein VFX02_13185 [Gammaproteobacteria bacterium]|nr:hypothetical protein [Gammaproteobacteria bacterium]
MKKYLLFLGYIVLMGDCAAATVQKPAELAATHGYVYVNTPKGGTVSLTIQPLPVNQEGNKKRSKRGKKLELIERNDPNVISFGRWLPEGEYKISEWNGYEFGDYPSFSVKAGHLTDLGSLILFLIGGYEIVVLPVRHPETAGDVLLALNEYKQFLVSPDPIEWKPQAPPKPIKLQMQSTGLGIIADLISRHEREVNKPSINKQLREAASIQDFFQLACAATPPLSDEPAVDSQSNLYYGADYGQIRMRKLTAEWSAIDTGTLGMVTAVEVDGESLMAGFDDGVIRSSANGGKTWKQLISLTPGEPVVDIDRVNDGWLVTTMKVGPGPGVMLKVEEINVYLAGKSDLSDLSAVKKIAIKSPYLVASLSVRAQAFKNFYYISIPPDLLRLDVSSMEWKTVNTKEVSGFRISPQSGTIAAYLAKGMFSKLYVSTDLGENWDEYKTPPYTIQDIYFEDKDKGRAVRMRADAFSGTNELLEYDSVKKDWRKTDEAPTGCPRVLWGVDNTPKFCVTSGGSILRHEKPQWAVEFSAE